MIAVNWLVTNREHIIKVVRLCEQTMRRIEPSQAQRVSTRNLLEEVAQNATVQDNQITSVGCVLKFQMERPAALSRVLAMVQELNLHISRFDALSIIQDLRRQGILVIDSRRGPNDNSKDEDPFQQEVRLSNFALEILLGIGEGDGKNHEDDSNLAVEDDELDDAFSKGFPNKATNSLGKESELARLLFRVGYLLHEKMNEGSRFGPKSRFEQNGRVVKLRHRINCLIPQVRTVLRQSKVLSEKIGADSFRCIDIQLLAFLVAAKVYGGLPEVNDIAKAIANSPEEHLTVYLEIRHSLLHNLGIVTDGKRGMGKSFLEIPNELFDRLMDEQTGFVDRERERGLIKDKKPSILTEINIDKASFPEVILDERVTGKLELLVHSFTKSGRKRLGRFGFAEQGVAALLSGPSGTGKTLAAMCVARKLGAVIYSVDCAKTRSMWYGQTEQNARAMFSEYRALSEGQKVTPVLLFNEADQLIGKRVTAVEHSTDQLHNSIQNILLEEFENFKGLLIATTNLKDNLDAAFSRRFLFQIEFSLPDERQRHGILKANLKKIPCDRRIDLESLAKDFALSGGEIKNAIHQACLEAVKLDRKVLTNELLRKAFETMVAASVEKETQPIGFHTN